VDFSLDETQSEVADLAHQILSDRVTTERLLELDEAADYIDRDLWEQFALTNLIGLALPESVGGSGYGLIELCALLEQVGRHVAPIPLLATVAMAGLPIAEYGSPHQQAQYLPDVIAGESILTAAMEEPGMADPLRPQTMATPDGDGWRLTGEKIAVPYGPLATAILVPATTPEGSVGVFIVAPGRDGVTIEPGRSTTSEPEARLVLQNAAVSADEVLGDPTAGTEMIEWIVQHALAGVVAQGLGVLDRSVGITGDYITEREQFGRPIATFQGATLRIADAFIDVEAIRVTAWSAIWRLAVGRPARDELAIAKFWIADGGQRASGACQHLHGGMGATTDYPIHRYFKASKQLEHTLGGSTHHLLALGDSLAEAK
jgi:alkylation response protein AidB-like acyl-CoA dehydrogenase